MVPSPAEVWVIDTSSITEIRRQLPKPDQVTVYASLTTLATAGQLVFPVQVLKELERAANPKPGQPDRPLDWCKAVAGTAVSNPSMDTLKEVLALVPEVLDPDKPRGAEEADPYILARAVELKRAGRDVTIITQDKIDKPRKLSLSSAAGILKLPDVAVLAFLKSQGLMP